MHISNALRTMNSFEIYESLCKQAAAEAPFSDCLSLCGTVVEAVLQELNTAPALCAFLKEASASADPQSDVETVSVIDGSTILCAVVSALADDQYRIEADEAMKLRGWYVFRDRWPADRASHDALADSVLRAAEQIRQHFNIDEKEAQPEEDEPVVFPSADAPTLDCSEESETDSPEEKTGTAAESDASAENTEEAASDDTTESGAEEKADAENGAEEAEEPSAPADSASSASSEWQELRSAVMQSMDQMQPAVMELYSAMLTFRSEFDERYTLTIGKKLIDLYCRMSDLSLYHRKAAEAAADANYTKCAKSIGSFMDEIEDLLSELGIELIVSRPGTPFDGHLHRTSAQNFDPAAAVVSESLSPGFRFGEVTLKAETVAL